MEGKGVVRDIILLLTFRWDRAFLLRMVRGHLTAGLLGTWLAGMGRYWDHPDATMLQHFGLGSLAYVFVLAAFLYLILLPYRVAGLTYRLLLTFITLTSFPAVLYAIPVERFTDMATAASINVWFLAVVASWRLALLYMFVRRFTGLHHVFTAALTLLPMALIVSALAVLNVEHAVFEIMGGIGHGTAHDSAYFVVLALSLISWTLLPVLLAIYLVGMVRSRRRSIGRIT